ncbi:HutD family protein [Paenibacillus sp. MBLB4367]|uniref:HutD/Ves family protein n=1 Tax=Paenibacillus sp. MBLB4367 TaxID=3384767 RepID=UPI0039084058
MSNSIKVLRKHEQKTTAWSGGTTTQLAIYPEEADYKERNFIWRISTATIDAEQTLFTSLSHVWRKLMVLKGELILDHEGSHRVYLREFDQDSFSGGGVTRSIGKATDFNLMMAEGCQGELEALSIGMGTVLELAGCPEDDEFAQVTEAFYCSRGRVSIRIHKDKPLCLEEGDLILIHRDSSFQHNKITIKNGHETAAHVVRVRIVKSSTNKK